jgi:hypothetical protein
LPRILIVPRVRQAIFYDGRHAWLTWLNLFLSLPVAAALLGVAVFVVSGVFGKVAVNFAVVLALAAVITLMLLAKVGYVLCAGPLLLAGGLYLSTGIPARVKLAHIVLSLITFVFYIICANSSPGPLMQF